MVSAVAALSYEGLCRAREDGNRYELIEGALVVVASPSPLHQRGVLRLDKDSATPLAMVPPDKPTSRRSMFAFPMDRSSSPKSS